MAEITRCRHEETQAEAELPTDALAAWIAHGWEPISDSRTVESAEAERVTAENTAAAHVQDVVEAITAQKLTVAEVLEEVGDDPAAAAAALQVEQSTENPRSTLVARLNQITNPAGDAGTPKEN